MFDPDRGTGRTLRQLQAAPDDFYFVIKHMSFRGHVHELMQKHDIKKSVIFTVPSDVYRTCIGTRLPIVVDHDAVDSLDARTAEWLAQHMSRYNPDAQGFTGA